MAVFSCWTIVNLLHGPVQFIYLLISVCIFAAKATNSLSKNLSQLDPSLISHPDRYNNSLILTGPSAHLFSHSLIWVRALWPLLTSIWEVNFHDQISMRFPNGFLYYMQFKHHGLISVIPKVIPLSFTQSWCGFFEDIWICYLQKIIINRLLSLKAFLPCMNMIIADPLSCLGTDWWWCLIVFIEYKWWCLGGWWIC